MRKFFCRHKGTEGQRGRGQKTEGRRQKAEDGGRQSADGVERIADRKEKRNTIPKILRYSFIVLVLLINQKDYEHFNKVWREIVWLWCFAFAHSCYGGQDAAPLRESKMRRRKNKRPRLFLLLLFVELLGLLLFNKEEELTMGFIRIANPFVRPLHFCHHIFFVIHLDNFKKFAIVCENLI